MVHRGGRDPSVVTAEAPAAGTLSGGDASEAARNLGSDGEERIDRLNPREGGEPTCSCFGVYGTQYPQLELGDSDH